MSSLLSCSINKEKSKKLVIIAMLLFCTLPIILNAVVLVPLYTSIQSNVAFDSSPLGVIIKYFQDFLDLSSFAVSYALIIFSALLISRKRAHLAVLLYTVSFALRIPLRLVMNIAIYGTLGTSAQITVDIIYLLVYFSLEMLQLLIVYIFAVTDSNKYIYHLEMQKEKRKKASKSKNNKKDIQPAEQIKSVLPLSKMFDWYNPLQRSAMKMSILILVMKIISRILNDISIGAPQSFGEVMVMIMYYLSDVLYGIVAYIIALITFNVVYDKLKEKETDEEESSSVI